jgi:hypothetical protein
MVNPKKVKNVICRLEYPFFAVSSDSVGFIDLLKYGNREFQFNAILVDIDD